MPTIFRAINKKENNLAGHLWFNLVDSASLLYSGNESIETTVAKPKVAICLAGFNRTGTEELLFKVIAKNLNMKCCVFDYSGFGYSEGNNSFFTIDSAVRDLAIVIREMKNSGFGDCDFYAIAHSLGAAILGKMNYEGCGVDFKKSVLIAPALNQAKLMRYWFVKSKIPAAPAIDSFHDDFDLFFKSAGGEEVFLEWCDGEKVFGKDENKKTFLSAYWQLERDKDYSEYLDVENVLQINATNDSVAPKKIATTKELKSIDVVGANHDFFGNEIVVSDLVNRFFSG